MPDVDEGCDFPDDLIEDGVKIVELLDVGDTFDLGRGSNHGYRGSRAFRRIWPGNTSLEGS
ncbi:MAG: hypothetical protein M0000_12030 [Actinomycetota bacterium]|nr:hypothetical protein [Actinomycetota bacterium]